MKSSKTICPIHILKAPAVLFHMVLPNLCHTYAKKWVNRVFATLFSWFFWVFLLGFSCGCFLLVWDFSFNKLFISVLGFQLWVRWALIRSVGNWKLQICLWIVVFGDMFSISEFLVWQRWSAFDSFLLVWDFWVSAVAEMSAQWAAVKALDILLDCFFWFHFFLSEFLVSLLGFFLLLLRFLGIKLWLRWAHSGRP